MPFTLPWGITGLALRGYHAAATGVTAGLHAVSRHTGVPVVVVAALAIVLSYRLARRAARLAVELAVVLALLLVATQLGWIHW
jgi:hypothetical protein